MDVKRFQKKERTSSFHVGDWVQVKLYQTLKRKYKEVVSPLGYKYIPCNGVFIEAQKSLCGRVGRVIKASESTCEVIFMRHENDTTIIRVWRTAHQPLNPEEKIDYGNRIGYSILPVDVIKRTKHRVLGLSNIRIEGFNFSIEKSDAEYIEKIKHKDNKKSPCNFYCIMLKEGCPDCWKHEEINCPYWLNCSKCIATNCKERKVTHG